jgi:hypothetical protein
MKQIDEVVFELLSKSRAEPSRRNRKLLPQRLVGPELDARAGAIGTAIK